MTDEEKREHARRIAKWQLEDCEFCNVYEDEELEFALEQDLKDIHKLIIGGTVTID